MVTDVNGRFGLIDTQGRIVVEPIYDEAASTVGGLALVAREHRYGFVDGTGEVVVPPEWDDARSFSEGLAVVGVGIERTYNKVMGLWITKGGEFGYIDRGGNIVIAPAFEEAQSFREGVAWVKSDGLWGLIGTSGDFLIPPRFHEEPVPFSEGKCPVWFGGEWSTDDSVAMFGYVDKSGSSIIPAGFRGAGAFSEGLAAVVRDGELGFIDSSGSFVIEPRFAWESVNSNTKLELPSFREGLAPIQVEGRTGFIDRTGGFVIEPRFEPTGEHPAIRRIKLRSSASPCKGFYESLAAVPIGDNVGYIDKAGRTVIDPVFWLAEPFEDGIARVVKRPRRAGYVDRRGEVIWDPGWADGDWVE